MKKKIVYKVRVGNQVHATLATSVGNAVHLIRRALFRSAGRILDKAARKARMAVLRHAFRFEHGEWNGVSAEPENGVHVGRIGWRTAA